MKIAVFLGGPGSGKGTQAKLLAERFGYLHISTGDMLRASVAAKDSLGQKVQQILESGGLVSDDIMKDVVAARLSRPDCRKGVLLDGFPRTLRQAEDLTSILASHPQSRLVVLNIDVPAENLQKRLCGRRSCAECGRIYNIYFQPPRQDGACDTCGVPLAQRRDDQEEVVRQRLEVYARLTEPLIAYYRDKGMLNNVDGQREVAEIFEQLSGLLQSE